MSDTIEVRVPDIGDFKDIPVIEVLVKPGDTIAKDDSLIALESDKATMEVPSPAAGIVTDLKIAVGDKVSQGSLLLTMQSASQNGSPQQPQQPAPESIGKTIDLTVPDIGDFKDIAVVEVLIKPGDRIEKETSLVALESDKATMEVPASAAGTIEDVKVKVGDTVSQGTVVATLKVAGETALRQAQGDSVQAQGEGVQARGDGGAALRQAQGDRIQAQGDGVQALGDGGVHASPSIRRFARELGVDLPHVRPSGPNGRVTRDDVQNFVKAALQTGGAPSARGGDFSVAPWPKVDFAQYGEIERKPLSRIQKLSGPNLHRNWVMIPHVTQNDDADVTDLETFRNELNAELGKSGAKVTMLGFLIKASVAALKEFPNFNSSLDGDSLVLKKYYNVGFAADTPGGLVVPVIKNADRKGLVEIAKETSELASRAREGKLGAADMAGGTFTISSLGSIGGTYFTPIINAPEVAILGACRAAMRPVWDGSQFVPRLMQPLSLSYDHRVIDGAAAARFTTFVTKLLADMRRALL
ncbi:MAG TPA: dihydrolipoyllysine-residue acetyltransferase [Candidatus Baltobacteraceae bacterium]